MTAARLGPGVRAVVRGGRVGYPPDGTVVTVTEPWTPSEAAAQFLVRAGIPPREVWNVAYDQPDGPPLYLGVLADDLDPVEEAADASR